MKRFSLFFILTLIAATAEAQSIPDDLRGLINQASTNYPRLKEQQQQLRAGEVHVAIARSAYQPTITGNGIYQYVTPVAKATLPINGQDATIQFQPNHNVNANIGIGQTLYDFGRTDASIKQAVDQVQLLRRNLELTRQNLGYQVAAVYYGIGFLEKSLVVQDSVITVAQGNIRIFANRLQNGEALQYDLLTQQFRLKTAQ
ncbi:MAG: TolC family protein, partial [Sphingobacteriales bacterium]